MFRELFQNELINFFIKFCFLFAFDEDLENGLQLLVQKTFEVV